MVHVIALHLSPAVPVGGGAVDANDWCIIRAPFVVLLKAANMSVDIINV